MRLRMSCRIVCLALGLGFVLLSCRTQAARASAKNPGRIVERHGPSAGWWRHYTAQGLRRDYRFLDLALLWSLEECGPVVPFSGFTPRASSGSHVGSFKKSDVRLRPPPGGAIGSIDARLGAVHRRDDDEDEDEDEDEDDEHAATVTPAVPTPAVKPTGLHSIKVVDRSGSDDGALLGVQPEPASVEQPQKSNPRTEGAVAGKAVAGPVDQVVQPVDPHPLSGLYRRSDPLRGWTGPGERYRYFPADQERQPRPDRWSSGWQDHAIHDRGSLMNPYRQNILKGDFPIYRDDVFLVLTGRSDTVVEARRLPTPSGVAARHAGSFDVFGRPEQHAFKQNLSLTLNLFVGDTAFEPPIWNFQMTPVWNLRNNLRLAEVGGTEPDVRRLNDRERSDFAMQELSLEKRMKVWSPYYDFVSLRVGRQPFVSDFRGFIFNDVNQGLRLFGNRGSNRTSFNIAAFDMLEKDINSELLTSEDRGQTVLIANVFRQDFVWPGYTIELSYHYNHDDPDFLFDDNGFLARPDLIGSVTPHEVHAHYYGISGDGHIGWLNLSHAFYHVAGRDSFNNLAGDPIKINAQMAALELSYEQDWKRLRTSVFFSSGDRNPIDGVGRGFDTILDLPNFAGGDFSFWQRQGIRLQGVGLNQRQSLVPNLRSGKLKGQSNFVNPGLILVNAGIDAEVAPKIKAVINLNYLRFNHTEPLQLFLFQGPISKDIGFDLSLGVTYRPDLNENIVVLFGVAGFKPSSGFADIYGSNDTLGQAFAEVKLTY